MKILPPIIKNRFTKSWLLIFVFLAFVFLPAVPRSELLETIDILTGEWKPYTSKDMEGYGLASEIVTRVLKRMGYRPNYVFIPFDRAYELALNSDAGVRGTFPFWKMSFIDRNGNVRDRVREMYFSDALTTKKTNMVIFYNTKQDKASKLQQAEKISDLSGCKLVAVKGYAYPTAFKELLKESESVEREVEAFKKLFDKDKPYLVLAEKRVGNQILHDTFADKKEEINIINEKSLPFKEDIHFITSRRNPNNQKFIEDFNENLEKLRAQGVIDALQSKYPDHFEGAVVRLNSCESSLIPMGREKLHDDFEYKLPRGTQGIVIKWGGEFDSDNNEFYKFTLIEIMNGPQKGKELFIENKFIELP